MVHSHPENEKLRLMYHSLCFNQCFYRNIDVKTINILCFPCIYIFWYDFMGFILKIKKHTIHNRLDGQRKGNLSLM